MYLEKMGLFEISVGNGIELLNCLFVRVDDYFSVSSVFRLIV